MFSFFKRAAPAVPASRPAALRPAAPTPRKAASRADPGAAAALPEVVEGSEDTDWALWENSVTETDSQMQGLMPSARVYEKEPAPSQLDELDPFSSVSRNAP